MSVTITLKGLTRLFGNLDALSGVETGEILMVGAQIVQDAARANIAAQLYRNSTGHLASEVRIRRVNQWAVKVGVWGVIYAAVHEYGAVITPKNAEFLHFFVDGEEVFTKQSVIPARPYMRPAVEDNRSAINAAMAKKARELIEGAVS